MRKEVEYRLRASKLAKEASETDQIDRAEKLQSVATNWVKLARNEDWLREHSISTGALEASELKGRSET